ncbi:hypothetical protein V8E53_007036 [Lactarius tabidus]
MSHVPKQVPTRVTLSNPDPSVTFDSKAKVGALVQRACTFKKQKIEEEEAEEHAAETLALARAADGLPWESGRIWKDSGGELERFWMDLGRLGNKAMGCMVHRGIYPIGQRYGHGTDMCWMPLA